MNKITKKKFRVKNGQEHSVDFWECFLKGVSQAVYLGEKVCELIRGLSIYLSKKESEEK